MAYFLVAIIHSSNTTFVPGLKKIGDLSCIISYLVLPGFLMDKLFKWNFLFSLCFQSYPRTTRLNFITQESCSLSISTITFTPTIPARQNDAGEWLNITFWLPQEIQLVDQNQCHTELRGIQNITIQLKASCQGAGVQGLKAIIPRIRNLHHSNLWHPEASLPTIWVCTQVTPIFFFFTHSVYIYILIN